MSNEASAHSCLAWKCGLLAAAAVAELLHGGIAQAQACSCNGGQAAGSDPSVALLDDAGKRREAILDEMRQKLGDLHATENADYDFAALQRIYAEAARKMALEELKHGQDKDMRSHAAHVLGAQEKDRQDTERWIERFHQFD